MHVAPFIIEMLPVQIEHEARDGMTVDFSRSRLPVYSVRSISNAARRGRRWELDLESYR
jgi:hypothetical protein